MSKPASLLLKASPVGKVRYPPCEIQDDAIKAYHHKFKVQPASTIKQYPRHIPYNSDKKTFQERTGRDAFEAFHYTFRMPGDPKDKDAHVVMWDYNVGLVRITALFKSLKHPKTMPAKVMNSNPGLKEISHSITGGSISAQGYWIPFEAARAIAAKFCWEIRYVLTPLFGADFPETCLRPDDPYFLKLNVDKSIVQYSTELADRFRNDLTSQSQAAMPVPRYASTRPKKLLRPKPVIKIEYESGYGTDTDRSPSGSPRSSAYGWTAVNHARKANPPPKRPYASIEPQPMIQPDKEKYEAMRVEHRPTKRRRLVPDAQLAPAQLKPTAPNYHEDESDEATQHTSKAAEARAAYALVALHKADITFAERAKSLGRRASWPT